MKPSASEPKRARRTTLRGVFFAGLLGYLAVCVAIAVGQRRLIYFPTVIDGPTADRAGATAGLVRWNNASGVAIGWKRLSPKQPSVGSVLVLHGNGGFAFDCAGCADALQPLAALDVFILEYPGYSDRPGKPTEDTLNTAAEEALVAMPQERPIYLMGESLGTGVATWLAGKHPEKVAGVLLLAPYNRLSGAAQIHYPWLPTRLLLIDQFASEDYLRGYSGPVAFLVGDRDPVVPAKLGRRLYDGYAGPKRFWEFPDDDHGTVMEHPPEVWSEVLAFLQGATLRAVPK
jgi:pimeloyl-ACP methyl ester carboxylesterase